MKPLLIAASAIALVAIAAAWFVLISDHDAARDPTDEASHERPAAVKTKAQSAVEFAPGRLRPSAVFRDLSKTAAIGDYRGGNEEHWDFCPPDAMLAGFEVSLAKEPGEAMGIVSLRAIFRGPDGDRPGMLNGVPASAPKVIMAKPGYAVGAVEGRGGARRRGCATSGWVLSSKATFCSRS